jgi:hypothetical protein
VTPGEGGTWADLGAGTGAFTLALADLIGPHGVIHAIDRDGGALNELRSAFVSAVPQAELRVRSADFTRQLDLSGPVLALVRGYLKHRGRLLLVEYDSDRGNTWVPHPMSFGTWRDLATDAGFLDTRRLATVPSRFLHSIYSALSLAP